MAKDNELVLKPIGELLSESFFIPAYQRGYRWNKRQVIDLLEDIKEFQQLSEEGPKESFYCLQPIVVKAKGSEWELVDGQQRLTTIYIILVCLKKIADALDINRYSMRYETRPTSAEFLNEIDKSRRKENIDFHHICEALEAIEEWFSESSGNYKVKFLQTLLNGDEIGKNVKVIWYQVNEKIDATAVFSRLNVGKIPLTNAELVKAIFLRSSNFVRAGETALHLHQLKIAQEWDSIEKQLQNDEFWYFVSNSAAESNRIEFVLRLAAKAISDNEIPPRDPLFIFLSFNSRLSSSDTQAELEWILVKRFFMTLNEWFTDRVLFHLIGYLVCLKESIRSLMTISQQCSTRDEFRLALVKHIFKKAMPELEELDEYGSTSELRTAIDEQLEQLTYDSGRPRLLPVLLLFNVASLLANPKSNSRFQFNRYKSEAWDIEHIRSVASDMPGSKENQKLWLRNVVQYISEVIEKPGSDDNVEASNIRENSMTLLDEKVFNSDKFELLFNRVLGLYDPDVDDESDDSIGNLTLLDSSTNRSYKNSVFPVKRTRIITLDKSATFVPLCTKNAFLKYYSKQVDRMMFWEANDIRDHQQAMAEIFVGFFDGHGAVK